MATVTENIISVKPPKKYTIELSEQEAFVLSCILAKVGGSPTDSLRKHIESLCLQLNTFKNIRWNNINLDDVLVGNGTIFFKNNSLDNDYVCSLHHHA